MKTIVVLHPSVELYGADRILSLLLQFFREDGYSVYLILPKEGQLLNFITEDVSGVKIIIDRNLPVLHRKLGLLRIIKYVIDLPRFTHKIKELNPDIIYCNTLAVSLCILSCVRAKKILHVHEIINNGFMRFAFSFLSLFATQVFCVSNHVKKNIDFLSVNKKKYIVIYNGIEKKNINRNLLINTNTQDKIFLLPGRIMPEKGQWFLIETLHRYPEILNKNVRFVLVGGDPPTRTGLTNELLLKIKQYSLDEKITVKSFVTDLSDYYLSATAVLVPSIMADPFPTTVLEAMSYSKPVITTNHGGASEIICNNQDGLLVSPNNYKELFMAINKLLSSQTFCNELGQRAYEKFITTYTLNQFKKNILYNL